MSTTTTDIRAERILELWRNDPRFAGARRYLAPWPGGPNDEAPTLPADIGNGASEAVARLFRAERDERSGGWIDRAIDEVTAAGIAAGIDAMAARTAELLELAPHALVAGAPAADLLDWQERYAPVTIEHLDRDRWDDGGYLEEGQSAAMGAIGFTNEQFEKLPEDHPAILEWEKIVDEVYAEMREQIGDMFYEALSRRLPWTWEPPKPE